MTLKHHQTDPSDDALIDKLPHVLIALLLGVSFLLLSAFMSLLDEMNERGEQRRLQQRTTGSVMLVDDIRMPSVTDARAMTVSVDAGPAR